MNPSRGYYSLIQYCPDLSRAEAANVGVLLFVPERHVLEPRMARSNHRVRRFFGPDVDLDVQRLNAAKQSMVKRIAAEGESITTVDELRHFIATRGNELLLTDPRPVKVFDPVEDLEHLFAELVGGHSRREAGSRSPVVRRLDDALRRSDLSPRIRFNEEIQVPVVQERLIVPYMYQNGTTNLVIPHRFEGARALRNAESLACKGDLIQGQKTDECRRNMIVVPTFGVEPKHSRRDDICSLFEHYHIRLVREDEVDRFVEEIDREAH